MILDGDGLKRPGDFEDMSSIRDYLEDFTDENGNYCHMCPECKKVFFGHKRRLVCNACRRQENN